jgi:Uncharacterised nucleotidyltransferase
MISAKKAWILRQLFFGDVLRGLDEHFAKLSIRYMPIKGAYLIAAGLAEKMPFRRMDDIDILVMPSDFAKAVDYFKALKDVRFKDNYWPFEASFHYGPGEANAFVELHYQLNYPERFSLPAEALFSRSTRSQGMLVLPCPEDSLIIFLCHMFVHIPFEIRETAFDEIDLLRGQDSFSWEKFRELSLSTGLGPFFYYLLRVFEKRKKRGIPHGRPTLYATLCARMIGIEEYRKMPIFLRRMVLEIPFAKDPLGLILKKLRFE